MKFFQNHGPELRDAAGAESQNHVPRLRPVDDCFCGFGEGTSIAGFVFAYFSNVLSQDLPSDSLDRRAAEI